jgi:hypothetical protein
MSHAQASNGDTFAGHDQLRDRIESFAFSAGLPPVEVIRRAFEAYVAPGGGASSVDPDDDSVEVVLRRSDLIGCLVGEEGSPRDLSTNSAHMEGFGHDSASGR